MKWILPAILLPLTFSDAQQRSTLPPAPTRSANALGTPRRVVDIHDGDGLTVMIKGHGVKVRIEGIDAPEKGQAAGEYSRAALTALVAGGGIRIAKSGTDRSTHTELETLRKAVGLVPSLS